MEADAAMMNVDATEEDDLSNVNEEHQGLWWNFIRLARLCFSQSSGYVDLVSYLPINWSEDAHRALKDQFLWTIRDSPEHVRDGFREWVSTECCGNGVWAFRLRSS